MVRIGRINRKKYIIKPPTVLSVIIFLIKISLTHTQHHYKLYKSNYRRNPCPAENKIPQIRN